MSDRVIDNPIVNGPYDEPGRHFRFGTDGITDELVEARRPSSYFVPVPRPRKGARQLEIPELTVDQITVNEQVNNVRDRVALWRKDGYAAATVTSRQLLEHWADAERDNRILFCQREAAETAIYLAEVADKAGSAWIANTLADLNAEHNDGLPRTALKMATGSGKTVVMAMLIAWQTLNKVVSPRDRRFTKRFLVVSPGITIRDRLRVLLPADPDNYYRLRDLVPAELLPGLGEARIAITNYHGFMLRETSQGKGVSSTTKAILAGGTGRPSPFEETPDQMVSRVVRDLGGGSSEVMVLNDEAHHCYRGRTDAAEQGADTEATLVGEDKKEAKDRNKEARVWFTGLQHIARKIGVKRVYDLSATPFFLAGSGYREGTLFPWVVSDFSLIDAIESGIVKIPRLPVDDDRVASTVTYLDLWGEVRDHLPKRGRRDTDFSADNLPAVLEGAMESLYSSYSKRYDAWQRLAGDNSGETPPVFIVVCNNTTVSKAVYDWIGGWSKTVPGHDEQVTVPGRLDLLSNVEAGHFVDRPRTILVDSQQLESGEAMSAEFKRVAAGEIDDFKSELRQRFPGRSVDDLTDEDLLREVMNTVGKQGKLGEHIRCVVSVSMLTEGWDANTVTHILGVRAFGTQLLCEQVVGRGLRRRSYAIDPESGTFTPEYADVYGVPFQFIPTVAQTKDLPATPTNRVHADPERKELRITFPRLTGYRVELPDERLVAGFDPEHRPRITKDALPTRTVSAGVLGESEVHDLDGLARQRTQRVAFEVAKVLVEKHLSTPEDPRPWYFPQAVPIAKEWLTDWVDYGDDCFPGLFLLTENAHWAAEQIFQDVLHFPGARIPRVRPVFSAAEREGSTDLVDFFTTREVYATSELRSPVNFVVLDGGGNAWERSVAKTLEAMPRVVSYVKNDHLGFSIPYVHKGRSRQFFPDFLVRLRGDEFDDVRTLVVEVSGGRKDQAAREAKAETARDQWVAAVNNHGGFGRWGFCEVDDPAKAKKVIGAAIEALG